MEPLLVGGSRFCGIPRFRVQEDEVRRRRFSGVQALQGRDEDRGNFGGAHRNDLKGRLGHVFEVQHVGVRTLRPGSRLDAVPPAVVRSGELDYERTLRVEPAQSRGAHDGLRAGHVERTFLFLRKSFQLGQNFFGHDGVDRSQNVRTQIFRLLPGPLDESFVGVVAAHVDAVAAGDVDLFRAVDVRELGSRRGLDDRRDSKLLPRHFLKLKGHAIRIGESQVAQPAL
mmetsp:Transcript_11706/g.38515  ORF Transcript_11706/g.38515 Transcript_11706/m.38515 type:complete len:227 (+) Transcript_11706:1008-1688(+)